MNFSRYRLPLGLLTLLVAALLWAPLWGHLHSIGHGIAHFKEPGTHQSNSASAGLLEAHAHAGHGQGEQGVEDHSDALRHKADPDLCRVLDHLSQAEQLSAPGPHSLAPMGLSERPTFRAVVSSDQDRWSPAQARAPPVLI